MIRYRRPEDVKSPRDMISNLDVRHNGGPEGVSVVEMSWGNNDNVIGMRWNASMREQADAQKQSGKKECLGMPISSSYPVWFILPDELFEEDSELWDAIQKIRNERLKKK